MAWDRIAARLRSVLARVRGLFLGARPGREFDEELESHLRMHADDNVRAGMTPEEARRQAVLALGSLPGIAEECRDRRGYPALAHLLQDFRYGARALRKNRAFTTVAVLTLGLGIGANTAIFSVVNAVVLQPLPYPEQERLVHVWATNESAGDREDVASYADFAEWRAAAKSFTRLAAYTSRTVTIDGVDRAELVTALQATPGFFEVLGVAPARGRTFLDADTAPGAPPVALIADSLWQSRFGRGPDVIGKDIVINEERRTIVGVLPAGFEFSTIGSEQVYVPRPVDFKRGHSFLRVIGRLQHGIDRQAAQVEMDAITARIAAANPDTNEGVGANVVPLARAVAGDARTGLLVVLGVVFIVLLIACANVVNLVLARHSTRHRELALRAALGASRWRILQQLVAESLLLSLCGGAVGLLLSTWGTRILVLGLSANFKVSRIESAHVDPTVLAITLAVCVVSGLLFGVAPALSDAAPGLAKGLRESSRTISSRRNRRMQALLIVGETGLALILLAAAGTLLNSLLAMRPAELTLASEHVLVIDSWVPGSIATNRRERLRYFEDVRARVGVVPGVRSSALVASLPLSGGADTLDFHIKGRPDPAPDEAWSANFNIASAGYFSTMSIPVLTGREFTADDREGARQAIVVNQSAARRFWPDENAVGQEIMLPGTGEKTIVATVVGVAGDVRQASLGTPARPEIYLAVEQQGPDWHLTLVARTDGDAAKFAGVLKDVAQSVNRHIPVAGVYPLREVLDRSLAEARLLTAILAVFAGLAILLAAVGLYGVVSYSVAQRTSEIGIRLALGAERRRVVRAVLAQALRLSLAGSVLGLIGAAASVRLLLSLFDGAKAGGPLTLAAVALLLNAVALGAGYLPARRAARIDPAVALRNE